MSVKMVEKAHTEPQGARVLRAEEYQALTNAIDACRRFTQRQNTTTYQEVGLAMRTLGILSQWNRRNFD